MRIGKSFFRYVDKNGNMPFISNKRRNVISHPYFIQYKDNKPIAYHGPSNVIAGDITNTKVWDYSESNYVPISLLKAI